MTKPTVGELERRAKKGEDLTLRGPDYEKYEFQRIARGSAKGGARLTIKEAERFGRWDRRDIEKYAVGHVVFDPPLAKSGTKEAGSMRVMVIVKATAQSETGALPSAELLEAMGTYNEALLEAGILLAGDGLKPSSEGVRVAFDGAGRTVLQGPFAAAGELVAGYWLWQVKDMDEAVEWVKRCPNPMPGPSVIEIRPLFEIEDFADA